MKINIQLKYKPFTSY